ncbi:hypothetical protein GQ42DRAFT_181043 [Ramicandelaber brevisporus]|nr:hypothetical protein GQ42DRAFT_181043 [Ramicandelaber brevisporus]
MGKDTPSIANSDADSTRELLSSSEQASLVRKISWRIIPLISMAFWLIHLDKSNISNARIYDLEKDLNMKPDDLKQQEIQRNLDNVNADVKEVKVDIIAEETDDDYSQWSSQILRSEIIGTLTFGFNVILFTYYLCHDTVSSAFSSYLPTIIRSMGFSKVQTQLLTIPHSVLSLIIMNVVAYFSDRQGKRARYAIAGGIISAFCAMMLAILSDHSRWVRYTFLNIVNPASSAMGPILLAWAVAANTSDVVNKYKGAKQTYALKVRLVAMASVFSMLRGVSGIIAGQMFRDEEAPAYRPTLIASTVLIAIATSTIAFLRYKTKHLVVA